VTMFRGIFTEVQFDVVLAPDVPSPVQIDPDQMKRVLINLIDNAIDAMNKKGKIALRVHFDKEANQVVIDVTDTGPGIPVEDKDRMFLPHFSTKKKGTGLGLAIVNQIIKEHNGTVQAQNNRTGGATFTLRLQA
jgi:two-component system, NtrC family, nitrogen regulation sensor histidine kinase NtrY